MHSISEYSSMIEQAISQLRFPGGALEGLYAPVSYGLQEGGKRLRPVLTLMTAEAFGAQPCEALHAALGIEMFHNFTLLHDDVMDNSPTRRGRPSVMAKYGVNSAILSGDTMLTLATQEVMRVPDQALRPVLDCFNRTAIEVYEGQQLDIDFESLDDVTLPEYLEMIRLKTSVLLGGAAEIGALIAGAPEQQAALIYKYAERLGLAVQIMDDLLDVYAGAEFGKPVGGDILNNKKTWLLLTALNSPLAPEVRKALTITDPQQKIQAVTALYDRLDMRRLCTRAIEQYTAEALDALNETTLSQDAKQSFRTLCEKLAVRSK